jgi:hypothetical protein
MARSGAPCEDTPSSGLRFAESARQIRHRRGKTEAPIPVQPSAKYSRQVAFQAVQATKCWRAEWCHGAPVAVALGKFVGYRRKSVNRVGSEAASPLLPTRLLPRASLPPSRPGSPPTISPLSNVPLAPQQVITSLLHPGLAGSVPSLSQSRRQIRWWKREAA